MKFIRNERDKFRLQCDQYFYVTHGGDCCKANHNKLHECKGYPCYIEMNDDMLEMLEENDITWAVQNLQSDNKFTKIIAEYIFNSYN